MNCERYRRMYDEYDAGSLHPQDYEAVRRHLGDCLPCRQFFQDAGQLARLASACPRVAAPDDFEDRLRSRLVPAREERRRPPALHWHVGVALAASVLLALGIWLGTYFQSRHLIDAPDRRLAQQPAAVPTEVVIPVEPAQPASGEDQIRFVTRDPATGREVLVEMPASYTVQDLSALEGPYLMDVSH
ncbi:MAG TPA: hypothetical protein PKN61_04025 [Acidobacteriota bacterium]|nr:hypothetical protein [Acidobacteriota bacterium]HNR38180.1 hypothetical protein [Acidobacteriota bacterium]HPB27747.1 hypothetical protein [Acidobacteriota bacterium]HQP72722.1 hypothetical protein [Acidobacteriota bacterium]